MFKRKPKPFCLCALAFAAGTILAFCLPLWLVAVTEAVIILIFGWMLFSR